MALRTRIKEYRARLDMTKEELANLVHSRRETIVYLEKGKYNPSLKLAFGIATALHTSVEDLFSFDDDLETER